MDPQPVIDASILSLLLAEDAGSSCAEQALVEYARVGEAAGRSLAAAEYAVALRYLNGEGVPVDLARARQHFETAAVFGHPYPDALRWADC